MSQLKIRCLGEFDVRSGDLSVSGFESQKVRALLAYLAVHRGRGFSRDHLAGLLWPEKTEDNARRNLRQALYNLKNALPNSAETPPVLSTHREVRLNPDLDCWVDVEAFDQILERGTRGRNFDPHRLAEAIALYRGDFLSDLLIKDSPSFEYWMLSEQERLRESSIEAIRAMTDSYLARGVFRLGIQYARRLVEIDPLSEEAHRYLIRLYALSGRRGRAIQQYEELSDLLRRELGVEPLGETQKLYQEVISDKDPKHPVDDGDPTGPIIPLVGREASYERIEQCWQRVCDGRAQLTLVEGPPGIGKTRLIKSFLGAVSFQREVTILKGLCDAQSPTSYQPFAQALENAMVGDSAAADVVLEMAPPNLLACLAPLVPELYTLHPDLPRIRLSEVEGGRRHLFECMADFLILLCQAAHRATGQDAVVLLLDDLHWAPKESLELITFLQEQLKNKPIWIIAAYRDSDLPTVQGLRELAGTLEEGEQGCHLSLEPLRPKDLDRIASSLLGTDQAEEFSRFLERCGGGLPLAVTEWINYLWNEQILVPNDARWRLSGSLPDLDHETPELADLLFRRLLGLPNSIRRMAILAAIMGQKFDVDLLQKAADEHPAVIEIGLEMMLERWLIRQFADSWTSNRPRRDTDLFAKGARRGNFEFNHKIIREAFYSKTNPDRREFMHRQLARAFEDAQGEGSDRYCELLAYHYMASEDWEPAFANLALAGSKAHTLLAQETAQYYYDLALEILSRIKDQAQSPRELSKWRREETRIRNALEEVSALSPN